MKDWTLDIIISKHADIYTIMPQDVCRWNRGCPGLMSVIREGSLRRLSEASDNKLY